jgi:hypothetical protein
MDGNRSRSSSAELHAAANTHPDLANACAVLAQLAARLNEIAERASDHADANFRDKPAYHELRKLFKRTLARVVALSVGLSDG